MKFLKLKLIERFFIKLQSFWKLLLITVLVVLISFIPIRLAWTYLFVPTPQAIFVLGGEVPRMQFAGKFWQFNQLSIWVSGIAKTRIPNMRYIVNEGVPETNIYYDICATDTVTNFTCTVNLFAKKKLWHLYLITSDYHMARARTIATVIFGSRGIVVTPISVPSQGKLPDSKWRVVRDGIRSVIWLVTGRTGARFNPRLYEDN